MSTGPRSQCDTCKRFRSRWSFPRDQRPDGPTCAAFPDGIPDKVFGNGLDHRLPIDGDHGLQWTAADGEEFPEWAFLPQFLGKH